ncbi:hypothetical protein DYB37_009423, partial [Aphanomyces astaci]
ATHTTRAAHITALSRDTSATSTDSTTEEKDDAVRRNAATAPVFFRNSFRHSFRAPSD